LTNVSSTRETLNAREIPLTYMDFTMTSRRGRIARRSMITKRAMNTRLATHAREVDQMITRAAMDARQTMLVLEISDFTTANDQLNRIREEVNIMIATAATDTREAMELMDDMDITAVSLLFDEVIEALNVMSARAMGMFATFEANLVINNTSVYRGVDLSSIPSVEFKLNQVGDEKMCTVCLENFTDGETLKMIEECAHMFHVQCIGTWLVTQCTCPICRRRLCHHTTH